MIDRQSKRPPVQPGAVLSTPGFRASLQAGRMPPLMPGRRKGRFSISALCAGPAVIVRPFRPLFAEVFRNETQIICTTLSHDLENDPDVVALVGASAALTLSGIPFLGPIGAARVGYIGGEYVLNPQMDEMANSKLDLVV